MITPKIKVLRSHGIQYIPDLCDVTLSEEFRGRPILTQTDDMTKVESAAKYAQRRQYRSLHSLSIWANAYSAGSALYTPQRIFASPTILRWLQPNARHL